MKRRPKKTTAIAKAATDGGHAIGAHSVLNLQPLVARFVDDVLRAVRKATLPELEALLKADRGASLAQAVRPAIHARRQRQRRKRSSPVRISQPHPKRIREHVTPAGAGSVPLELDAITDPENLLVASVAPRTLKAVPASAAAIPNEQSTGTVQAPPPSSERRTGNSGPALRPGETLARASGAGVVIRRVRRK
jgi:hypothetical protein